jgi:molecular chaperone HtpG
VLLLDDAVDAFWVTSALGYEGKPFKSVTQGQADIDLVPLLDAATDETPPPAEIGDLVAALKETLSDSVEDVRVSTRLTESAACLIASDKGLDRQLARLLAESGQKGLIGKPVLEINPRHPAVLALAASLRDKGRDGAADGMKLLLDLARVADGEAPVDAAAFARRLSALIARAV